MQRDLEEYFLWINANIRDQPEKAGNFLNYDGEHRRDPPGDESTFVLNNTNMPLFQRLVLSSPPLQLVGNKKAPYTPGQSPASPASPRTFFPTWLCRNFNVAKCTTNLCRRKHQCVSCRGDHPGGATGEKCVAANRASSPVAPGPPPQSQAGRASGPRSSSVSSSRSRE
jgi:hypothetical protein